MLDAERQDHIEVKVVGCIVMVLALGFLTFKITKLAGNIETLLDNQVLLTKVVQQQMQQTGDNEFVEGAVSGGRVMSAFAAKGIKADKVTLPDLLNNAQKLRGTNRQWIEEANAKKQKADCPCWQF